MEFSLTIVILVVIAIIIFAILFHAILTSIFAGVYQEKLDTYINKFNQHLKRKSHELINEHDIDPGLTHQVSVYRDNGFRNVLDKSSTEFESYDELKSSYLSKTVGLLTYNQILDDKYGSDSQECIRRKNLALKQESDYGSPGIFFLWLLIIPLMYILQKD